MGTLECRRKIAGGRFGTVYLAWAPALEYEVALNILLAAESIYRRDPGRPSARPRSAPERRHCPRRDEYEGTVGLRCTKPAFFIAIWRRMSRNGDPWMEVLS
jgi:hypothetical protein